MASIHDNAGHGTQGPAEPWDSTATGSQSRLTLSFDTAAATLESCGGKGVNLVRLTRAGFRVPSGFVVTADAYRLFVAANDLTPRLGDLLAGVDPGDVAALEAASDRIRRAFSDGAIPVEVVDSLFSSAGGASVFHGSPIQQCFLDIHTARAHVANNPTVFARNLGAVALGAANTDFFV